MPYLSNAVGKVAPATDNAQFFHPRIQALPRLRSKESIMKDIIRQLIQQALSQLVTEGVLPEGLSPAIQVENAKDKPHGDFASNIAMMLAKPAGMKPRDLAEKLIAALPADEQISKVEIAGPGLVEVTVLGRIELASYARVDVL